MNEKTGCFKCDYTGYSYGKIPCECVVSNETVNVSPKKYYNEMDMGVETSAGVATKPTDISDIIYQIGDPVYARADGTVTTDLKEAFTNECVGRVLSSVPNKGDSQYKSQLIFRDYNTGLGTFKRDNISLKIGPSYGMSVANECIGNTDPYIKTGIKNSIAIINTNDRTEIIQMNPGEID